MQQYFRYIDTVEADPLEDESLFKYVNYDDLSSTQGFETGVVNPTKAGMLSDSQTTLKELYSEGKFRLRKMGYVNGDDNDDKFVIYSA